MGIVIVKVQVSSLFGSGACWEEVVSIFWEMWCHHGWWHWWLSRWRGGGQLVDLMVVSKEREHEVGVTWMVVNGVMVVVTR